MPNEKIKWTGGTPLKNESAITKMEELGGVKFPESFKEIIKTHNGAAPTPNTCYIDGSIAGEVDVIRLLSFNEDDPENIFEVFDLCGENGMVPFAKCPDSDDFFAEDEEVRNYICFYQQCGEDAIIWSDEEGREWIGVAKSSVEDYETTEEHVVNFDGFLESLRNKGEFFYNRGCAELQEGAYDRAFYGFSAAIKMAPDHAEAHSNLGTIYLQQGKMDQAIACFQKAAQLGDESAQQWLQENGHNW